MENKELEYVSQEELTAEEAEKIELSEEAIAELSDNQGDEEVEEDVEQSTGELHENITE